MRSSSLIHRCFCVDVGAGIEEQTHAGGDLTPAGDVKRRDARLKQGAKTRINIITKQVGEWPFARTLSATLTVALA
jgi:hypothetical protein